MPSANTFNDLFNGVTGSVNIINIISHEVSQCEIDDIVQVLDGCSSPKDTFLGDADKKRIAGLFYTVDYDETWRKGTYILSTFESDDYAREVFTQLTIMQLPIQYKLRYTTFDKSDITDLHEAITRANSIIRYATNLDSLIVKHNDYMTKAEASATPLLSPCDTSSIIKQADIDLAKLSGQAAELMHRLCLDY